MLDDKFLSKFSNISNILNDSILKFFDSISKFSKLER